jgi:hypothetical protein
MSFDEKELYWAAGFLEGEGSFVYNQGGAVIKAVQTDTLEPLERLQRLFGGSIRPVSRERDRLKGSNARDNWVWAVYGGGAIAGILVLYPQMSGKRRAQMTEAVKGRIPLPTGASLTDFMTAVRRIVNA